MKIHNSTFKALIKGAILQTSDDLEDVGFKCELGTAAISFFGNIENDYRVEVEDFGRMKGGKWLQYEPTEGQITAMQNVILSRVEEIKERKVIEAAPVIEEEQPYFPKYNHV
jgi:hypothetical protein